MARHVVDFSVEKLGALLALSFWASVCGALAQVPTPVTPGYQICTSLPGLTRCSFQPTAQGTPFPVTEFYQQVAEGVVTGYSSVVKVGFNPEIGVTDELISGAGIVVPNMPTAPVLVEAVSDSADDTAAGTGARSILVSGLDANFNEISELMTLDGVTPVVTSQSFIRVLAALVISVGTYRGANAGNVLVRTSGAGATFLSILAGQGTALTTHFCVPAGRTLFVHSFFAAVEGSKNASLTFWVGPGADVVTPPYQPIRASGRAGGVAATFEQTFNGLSGGVPEKTDLWVSAASSVATTAVTAEYAYILKTN